MSATKIFLKSLFPNSLKKSLAEGMRGKPSIHPKLVSFLAFDGDFSVKIGDRNLKLIYTNMWIENDVFWKGIDGYEKVSMDIWRKCAENAGAVMDVGANTGLFSLVAKTVNPSATVFSFEPLPFFRDIFVRNCRLNDFDIQIDDHALSNFIGASKFYVPELHKGNQYSSSLSMDHYLAHQDSKPQEVDVQVSTVDTYFQDKALTALDLVKIDAEGHDACVLEGMKETIQKFHPDFLIEVQSDEIGEQIMVILKPEEYVYYNIDEEKGARKVSSLTKSDTLNFFVCKPATATAIGLS